MEENLNDSFAGTLTGKKETALPATIAGQGTRRAWFTFSWVLWRAGGKDL
jgi:hypothetical protein